MLYALCWFTVICLLALWSLAAWAFHAAADWAILNAGALAGGAEGAAAVALPAWLAAWMPPELSAAFTAMVSATKPVIDSVLSTAPMLAGGLSVAVWVCWALGAGLLVLLGVVLSGVIAVMRRRSVKPAVAMH